MKKRHQSKFRWLIWRERLRNWVPFIIVALLIFAAFCIVSLESYQVVGRETATLLAKRRLEREYRPSVNLWAVELRETGFKTVPMPAGIDFERGKSLCVELRRGSISGILVGRVVAEGTCE